MKNANRFGKCGRQVATITGLFLAGALVANALAETRLATEPFTSSDDIKALPNVMFVLDDSGSMDSDYLPDWAGPYRQSISGIDTVVTPAYRFFNNAYNGVAYNPGTRYRPPVMFTNAGATDTTTYPSMTGQSAATGGSGTASAAAPNWKAVKMDGFGIQSTAVSDLEASAFSYVTVAGEYCDTAQLRNCVAASAPAGAYTFPAKLRWCTTPEKAIASTANSNTFCQANNIDSTPANLATGVTHYTFPRMAGPATAVIRVEAAGTVTGITVSGQQILSGSASRVTAAELVVEIAKKINACTIAITGSCAVAGYSAVSAEVKIRNGGADDVMNYVTIFAPVATSVTPVVTGGGGTTTSAFGTVPGSSLFAQISSSVIDYPYPGTAIKGENRKDCAGATCTYAEEMTNYANWYAYYRTRMQMMKTDSSIAFAGVDNKFRVGYFSINNAAGTQFLNPQAFDGVQKNLWYANFLRARPSGATPLRTGLANAGRIFSGKLTTLNGVDVLDPMQYSCQQNFTILSTDGYWNDASTPVQVDGTTAIGQQDSNLDRPYYDGGKWTRTTSRILSHEEQWGLNEFLLESMTQQQQTSTEAVSKVVTTTTTYPYTLQSTPLQTRVTPLLQTDSFVNQTEYPLYLTPTALTKYTQYYQSTSAPLNIYTNKLKVQSAKLNKTKELRVTQTATPLQAKTYKITATETNLIKTTYLLTKVTSQLQKNSLISTNGGDSWVWSGYSDVGSCTTRANSLPATDIGGGILVREILCRYVSTETLSGQTGCTIKSPSTGSPYSVANPVSCTYEAGTTAVVTGTFNTVAKVTSTANNTVYASAFTYAYATSANTPATGQNNCTTVGQSAGPNNMVGPARACTWDSTATSATDSASTCTDSTPAITGSGTIVKTVCGYTGTPVTTTVDTCEVARSAGSPYSVLTRIDCAYPAGDGSANAQNDVASCTQQTSKPTSTAIGTDYFTYRTCAFASATTTSPAGGSDSCGWSGGQVGINFTAPKVTCSYLSAALVSSNQGSCTAGSAATDTTAGQTWNKYTSCVFGTASAPTTNLSLCTPSGGQSGTNYTGPKVVCSNMTNLVAQTVATCTPSTPNPPVPLYSSAIVTCGYAASGAAQLVATCTPDTTGATGQTCTYGAGVASNNVASCQIVAKATGAGPYATARDCAYADQTAQSVSGACVPDAKDGGATLTPARACAYGTTPAGFTLATAACTPVAQAGFVGPGVECAYNGTMATTPAGSDCANFAADPGANFNILLKKVCVAGSNDVVTVTPTPAIPLTIVASCDTTATWDGQPATETSVRTTTACTYQPAQIADTPTCTPSGGVAGAVSTTRVTCPILNAAKTYVGTYNCAPTGSLNPDTFDANGTIVDCRRTDYHGTESAFEFVASCTDGLTRDDATHRQTQCARLVNTAPAPVDPLTCTDPSSNTGSPSFMWTFCTPDVTTAVVTGCGTASPVSPSWMTTTCTPIAGTGSENTLADVSAYYYYTDLRTPALSNCTGAVVPPATAGATLCSDDAPMNDVFATASDPATWQHMTTFTLGLGASGYMKYQDDYPSSLTGDFATVYGVNNHTSADVDSITADPATGVCSWQAGGPCNWPFPASDEQTTIDDLWHAGVNGHGAYFSATNPETLSTSIIDALQKIESAGGATAAPTISNPSLTPADNYIFSSTYKSLDWTGELSRRQLDPYTGAVSATIDWSVQAKLDAKSPATRNIYAFDASTATKLKAFTSANFATDANFLAPNISTAPNGLIQFSCTSPDVCLSAANQTLAAGANLVDYLRGVRTNEGALEDNNKYYRQRQHVLGDMVNAQAVYVNKPLYNFGDPGYSAFVTAKSSRQAAVFTAANDGMLHAFAAKGSAATETKVEAAAAASSAASLDPTNAKLELAASAVADANAALASDTLIGQELWAYIPTMVMPDLYKLADKKYKNKHRYFVDATPVVADICVADCASNALADWRTILVGGLGGGGRGFYALDITDPASPKALWEFTDANLGYSYGNPQIVKQSDGTWVVVLSSGYNNVPGGAIATGDGVGRLFVVNASTGALIRTLSTGAGGATEPSGLTRITAQVVNPISDNTAEAVYGGDLLGNLWRFDINNTLGAVGYDAQLLAILKDGAGNAQPITTKPEVALIPHANVHVVFIGTGRFLHPDDIYDRRQQSLYAIKDARATGTVPATAIYDNPGGDRSTARSATGFIRQVQREIDCPADTASNICVAGEKVRASTNNPVDFVLDSGWFVDLLGPDLDGQSERANTDPALALGLIAFNTNSPSNSSCDIGGTSYSYFLNYLTGGPIYAPGNGSPTLDNGVVGKLLANEFASAPAFVETKSGKLLEVSGLAGGRISVTEPPLPPAASVTRRTSWRELIRE